MIDPNDPNVTTAGEPMPNETLFEKAAELIHEAEAKVEALIHPEPPAAEAPPVNQQPAGATDVGTAVPGATPTSILDDLEQEVLFWGGEGMTRIRNHIGRLRQVLNL